MPTHSFIGLCAVLAALVGCNSRVGGHTIRDGGVTGDSSTHHSCNHTDTDHDGVSDDQEGGPTSDADADGIPNIGDTDDDGDGIPTSEEAGPDPCAPLDSDLDGVPDFLDLDSDNDGVPDAIEHASGTNPRASDTDGDGVDDIIELAAGSSPTDPTSMPPAGSLYVTIPYHPDETSDHPMRMFDFSTRIQVADVFILVDNSGSMGPIINALRSSFSSTIVPGIRAAISDVRIGVGSFDSVPDGLDGDPQDYTLWVRQRVDADASLSQNAFNTMNTIDTDTGHPGSCPCGGDYPEDQTEALFESISGAGMSGHESDESARMSCHNGLTGDGYVPTMDPVRDCPVGPDDPSSYGWACFATGRVPILVLASDASWYNGYAGGIFGTSSDPSQHTSTDLTAAMMAHGAYFVGIDVGTGVGGDTYMNASALAMATGTVDGSGNPVVFGPGSGGLAGAAMDIVNAITTLAGETPQDITTRTDPDATETRLPAGKTTKDFILTVTPFAGTPPAPDGFTRMDTTTFYGVKPSTVVTFNVTFYNDFQMPIATAQLFKATIQVLGRAGTIVDHRDVYMIVPAAGGTILH